MKIHQIGIDEGTITVPDGFPAITVPEFQFYRQITDQVEQQILVDCLKVALEKAVAHFEADGFSFPSGETAAIYFKQGVYAYAYRELVLFLPVNQLRGSDPAKTKELADQQDHWDWMGYGYLKQIPGFVTADTKVSFRSAVLCNVSD